MQEVIPEKIVRGKVGLDLGCGCGWDTLIMAKDNLGLKIISLDVSDSVYIARKLAYNFNNINIVKGSATDTPLKNEVCDFVYSFGVLHHISDYRRALLEICRVLKKDAPVFLYLYEDHAENPVKRVFIKLIAFVRKITIRIPPRMLYVFSCILSPLIFILLSVPAKFFKRCSVTYKIYEKMPCNFGNSPFSLSGDIYDRFATPIEHRFNKEELYRLFKECNFTKIGITNLRTMSGWVVWGYKKNA